MNFKYRMHDPRIGRFFAADPLEKSYPWNSPYAFSENRVIDGIELEGLEYFYSADGRLIGKFGDSELVMVTDVSVEYDVAKTWLEDANDNLGDECGYSACNDIFSQSTVIHDDHNEFIQMATGLYAEASDGSNVTIDEVASIYSVQENRADLRDQTVEEQFSVKSGTNGAGEKASQRFYNEKGPSADNKRAVVIQGLIKGITTKEDLSNGAFFWDGKDFNGENKYGTGGYRDRYKPGYKFTDNSHDLWKQKDNKVSGVGKYGKFDFQFESTKVEGQTTFSKLTDMWRDAQRPGGGKSNEMGE